MTRYGKIPDVSGILPDKSSILPDISGNTRYIWYLVFCGIGWWGSKKSGNGNGICGITIIMIKYHDIKYDIRTLQYHTV